MLIVVKGAGDLATGIACRLFRAGLSVVLTEVPRPTAVRRRRATSSPTASHMRRICLFFPSESVISITVRSGSSTTTRMTTGCVLVPSSSTTPSVRAISCSSVARGCTVTRYSFVTPWLGWVSRLANSPSFVSSKSPSLFRSSRPTG